MLSNTRLEDTQQVQWLNRSHQMSLSNDSALPSSSNVHADITAAVFTRIATKAVPALQCSVFHAPQTVQRSINKYMSLAQLDPIVICTASSA